MRYLIVTEKTDPRNKGHKLDFVLCTDDRFHFYGVGETYDAKSYKTLRGAVKKLQDCGWHLNCAIATEGFAGTTKRI